VSQRVLVVEDSAVIQRLIAVCLLPRMDGWQVLDHIRADIRTRNLKVLVLTAHAQEETRERANRGGANGFVTKPFRPDALRTVVIGLLNGVRQPASLG